MGYVWTIISDKFMSENCYEAGIRLTYGPNQYESKDANQAGKWWLE